MISASAATQPTSLIPDVPDQSEHAARLQHAADFGKRLRRRRTSGTTARKPPHPPTPSASGMACAVPAFASTPGWSADNCARISRHRLDRDDIGAGRQQPGQEFAGAGAQIQRAFARAQAEIAAQPALHLGRIVGPAARIGGWPGRRSLSGGWMNVRHKRTPSACQLRVNVYKGAKRGASRSADSARLAGHPMKFTLDWLKDHLDTKASVDGHP